MKRDLVWHDISACLNAGVLPEVVTHRGEDQSWHVCHSPLNDDTPLEWATIISGDMFRIPLVPYLCADNPESLAAAMLELGTRITPYVRNAVSVLMVVGMPVEHVAAGMRVWIGLAYRTK